MKLAIVAKHFRFEAAHHLPQHQGKCARPHGHSYQLEVALRGPIKHTPGASDHGMVMDFGDLKQIVEEAVIGRLDHYDLNEATDVYTTAENLAHWIWDKLVAAGLPEDLLYRLRLWETESCCVEITAAERGLLA
ncbi:MAG: 6-carboxytetrahydropterin synthase QueD [Chloroflexota bacterium]|nr:6-carboxytetrahydropterin synthase QueD [Chloroflexota bacterium]PLS80179.1 MAG: 6-carboxytetrahydropterin synthase QueD [Chloroflexota bacterium]